MDKYERACAIRIAASAYDDVLVSVETSGVIEVGDVRGGVRECRLRARPNDKLARDVDGLDDEASDGGV